MATAEELREQMVREQIARRGIADQRVLRAMSEVPREAFVPEGSEVFAYDDAPVPIGEGQTISQPFIVALMLEAARLAPDDKVLDVGLGSGYAAAVASRIAREVWGIEWFASLAGRAEAVFGRLGYDNIRVRVGDGSLGWPEGAPFDAILVAAGGPRVPETLLGQLAVGGRLVIPVDAGDGSQRLVRVTRTDERRFETDDLGGVRFVPLVGEEGWPVTERRPRRARATDLPAQIAAAAEPLPSLDDESFGRAFDRFGDRRVVLLGEASHGTSEFYRARAAITRRLVEAHGFNIIAVEADFPDAAAIDRHVRRRDTDGMRPFRRFPVWMWRNAEVARFVDWLAKHNAHFPPDERIGFYGLDLYNMQASIRAVLAYLDAHDPEAAALARERYGCLVPWQREPAAYGRAVLSEGTLRCEKGVVAACRDLLERQLAENGETMDGLFEAAQNARLVASAERYYRVMYHGGPEAWNLRDRHMFETLEQILEARGPRAKAVVWAHNSHIGDARYTEMGELRGEINLGQLARERFGKSAALIGFGTHTGTVAAASEWDGPMQVMRVNPSRENSYERLCHDAAERAGRDSFLVDLASPRSADVAEALAEARFERFIGVIYRPESEFLSHYAEASLTKQFDAWVWFDETRAVTPLPVEATEAERPGTAETWPFGL